MKKLIVSAALATFAMFASAADVAVEYQIAPIREVIEQYDELMALSKSKDYTKAERSQFSKEASALKAGVVNFGKKFSAVSLGTYRGVQVIPTEFIERYDASTNEAEVVDVYNTTVQLKFPYLNKGIRTYKVSNFKGYLVCEYAEVGGKLSNAWLAIKGANTKGVHIVKFEEADFWMLGTSNKYIARKEPSVFFEGADAITPIPTTIELHETLSKLTLAGGGTCAVKSTTTTVVGCNACGKPTSKKVTTSCVKAKSLSGFATGKMKCDCPEDEAWDHTLWGGSCGLFITESGDVERSSEASCAGKFSASYNTTLSVVNVKEELN